MRGIEISGAILKAVSIYRVGTGTSFSITIDNIYQGEITWMAHGWVFNVHSGLLYTADLFELIDIIEQKWPDPCRKIRWLARLPPARMWAHPPLKSVHVALLMYPKLPNR